MAKIQDCPGFEPFGNNASGSAVRCSCVQKNICQLSKARWMELSGTNRAALQ